MGALEQQRRLSKIRRKSRRAIHSLRRAARRLELRAVGLLPEQFSGDEGARAALAVGAPLILALVAGQPSLGWAVFAAFWTCLCDGPGPHAMRRRTLGLFVLIGTAIAFTGSWAASAGTEAALAVGPALVFVAVLVGAAFSLDGVLGTLLAVVAVVAVGFPHPLPTATAQSLTFLAGGSWAFLLIQRHHSTGTRALSLRACQTWRKTWPRSAMAVIGTRSGIVNMPNTDVPFEWRWSG